ARDLLLEQGPAADLEALPDDTQICNCNAVSKGRIVEDVKAGKCSIQALGVCNRAGTGCGTCQPLLGRLIETYGPGKTKPAGPTKVEVMKRQKDGLDCLSDVHRLAANNNWEEMTEDDKARFKWYGLFFRKPTPGHFMLRLRLEAGRTNARQLRVIANL